MLAMILALIAATSAFGLFPLVASNWASICDAVRICVARAEKSGWSPEFVPRAFGASVVFLEGGLDDLDVEIPELRGVVRLVTEIAAPTVLALDTLTGGVGVVVLLELASPKFCTIGELPRSPDVGSNTLSTICS